MGYQQKSYKKFVATAATATLVASAIVPVASAAGFSDVSENNEFAPYINALVEEGIINGYASDNTFRPSNKLTRGQVAIMLGRWLENNGATVPADWNTVSRFEDVPANATSAAGKELAKYAALVKDSGVFTGVLGNLNPSQNITRENMAVVLDRVTSTVAGISLVELAEEIEDVKVSDLATAQTAYQDEIQALADLGITTVSNFRPKEQLSRAQFAKFLYTTLEIIEEVTAPLSAEELKAEVASIVGTLPEVNAITTVEQAQAAKTVAAEATTALAEIETVIAEGEYTEAEVKDLNKVVADAKTAVAAVVTKADEVIEAAKAPAVESVQAINAEEILVTFNKEVTASAANKANYEISTNGVKAAGTTAIKDIQVAGNKALIRLNTASKEGDKYVIQTNDAIVATDGKAFPRYASPEYTYKNGAVASLQNVELDAATDKLTLTFDRPVNTTTTLIKVDGIELNSKTLTPVADKAGSYKYEVTLTGGNLTAAQLKAFKAEGSHEVVIFDVKDTAAANAVNNSVVTGAYTVTKDTAAPTVVAVKALSANKFFIETNRAVDLTSATLKVEKGTHEFVKGSTLATDTSKQFEAVGTLDGKPGIYVVVTEDSVAGDENPLYKGTESAVNLKVTLENYKANDLVGAKYVGNVTLSKDATKPEVKSTALDVAGNKLSVTFKEKLAAAPASTDVIVRDKDGVIIPSADVIPALNVADNSIVDFTVTPGTLKEDKAPYTVEFKAGTVQYAENKTSVADYIVKSQKNDKLTATVRSSETGFKYKAFSDLPSGADITMNNNVISIDYKTDMADTARQVANYKLDGKALPAGTTVEFVGSKQKVEITLPEGSIKTTTGYKLSIATDVTTKAGEHIVKDLQTKGAYEEVVTLVDNTKPELKSAVYVVATNEATATNKIKVTFNEDLAAGLNTTDVAKNLKIVINGSEQTGCTVADATAGDAELEVTLASAVAISQAATISVVADKQGDVHITDKSTSANKANVGSTVVANQKELDLAGALDLQAVNTAKANLTLSIATANAATSTITLPATQDGATVTWAVSGTGGTISGNTFTTAARTTGTQTATLTATITKGSATVMQSFTVTVANDTDTDSDSTFDNANTVTKN